MKVEPSAIQELTEAMYDIAHYLRTEHLSSWHRSSTIRKPRRTTRSWPRSFSSANIAAAGVLPMCQDTGTAIVMGKKGDRVVTFADDAEAISRGVFDTYTETNLRYSQLAPLSMFEEKNTGNNLPAQIELYTKPGDSYEFLFMAKGGGSANKSFLFQKTKALLNERSMVDFLDESLRAIGTSACPPYHLALVVGGTSAEYALKTANTPRRTISTTCRPRVTQRPVTATATSSGNRRSLSRPGSSASGPSSAASTSATTSG